MLIVQENSENNVYLTGWICKQGCQVPLNMLFVCHGVAEYFIYSLNFVLKNELIERK